MDKRKLQTPLAFYERGKSYLLSGETFESLRAYTKALEKSVKEQEVEMALNSINALTNHDQLHGYNWVNKFLLIGLAVKFKGTEAGEAALEQIKKIASTPCQPFEAPVIIVAGGCSSEVETKMRSYRGVMLEAFRDFKGTVVSGGTKSGISGLIGEVQQKNPNTVRTVGYIPSAKLSLVDKRYSEIRFTDGENFSLLEPLQYWIDLVGSGIRVSDVKLLGINGGGISAIEYRMALALGAQVAVVNDSGMEAEKLLLDEDWNTQTNLVPLPNDSQAIRSFIQM